ncbi:hypothetical protein EG831_04195 [bacterium]|nr:hypothetical protein [bacterium]
MGDPSGDLKRLEEYHRELAGTARADQAGVLRNGYLPDDPGALVEAGIRCIPLIESEASANVAAALDRLQAVVFKLKLGQETPGTRRAVERFQQLLDATARAQHRDILYGFMAIGGLLVVLGGIIAYIVRMVGR